MKVQVKDEVILKTPKSAFELDPTMSIIPIKLLGDRIILRTIPVDDKLASGLYRAPGAKDGPTSSGVVVSLGTIRPNGYSDIALGMTVEYYDSQAISMTVDSDKANKYHLLRFSDCTSIL